MNSEKGFGHRAEWRKNSAAYFRFMIEPSSTGGSGLVAPAGGGPKEYLPVPREACDDFPACAPVFNTSRAFGRARRPVFRLYSRRGAGD
jgi:hypothetical protein